MKQLSKSEMKEIVGGFISPPSSSCAVRCGDGTIGSHDCGIGVSCTAVPEEGAVYCWNSNIPNCPCDGHDIPQT